MRVQPNVPIEPMHSSHYASSLRKYIPKEAYLPATYKLVPMLICVAIMIVLVVLSKLYLFKLSIQIFGAILFGLTASILFVYNHELSHGVIVKKQPYRYLSEFFFWALCGVPATMWKTVHNATHHKHANTIGDSDRKPFEFEAKRKSTWYFTLLYPSRKVAFVLTGGLAMLFHTARYTLAVFLPHTWVNKVVTALPVFNKNERGKVAAEVIFIAVIQLVLFNWFCFGHYLLFATVSATVYSFSVMSFIVTQHFGDSHFKEIADPLLTTTSVIVPVWIDKVVNWHSYHVEHHVFPGINFDYYQNLSESFKDNFPEKYQRIEYIDALKRAYDKGIFMEDPIA